jgi:primary-amine oxidase
VTIHPLDPLTKIEISRAAKVIREQSGLDDTAWFETITLDEPMRAERSGENIRRVFVCCYEPSSGRTMRGKVDVVANVLLSWREAEGKQARIVAEEFDEANEWAKADPRVIEACAKRGVTDLSKVLIECWAPGWFGDEAEEGERLAYCHCWLINEAGDNRYGRPLANLHPVLDLRRCKVVRVDDFGTAPVPPDTAAIRPTKGLREDLKPIEISQPEGPSFSVDGWNVEWQKWSLRVGFDLREGLVLHDIGYRDGGRLRPIIRRASMAEMVVPYGDPSPGSFRRNAFDTGEYGIGRLVDSLKLGCDCLGYIHYFDIWNHDWHGTPELVEQAICMHEEDYGILWKHTDTYGGGSRVVRSRRLVISTTCTIGNYVYGFFWYFYQDGTIQTEIKATGIPFPSHEAQGGTTEYGAMVAPGVQSHVHQHSFCFRFDMAVDGPANTVTEVDFECAPPGPANPYGNAIRTIERPLVRESEAQRDIDLGRSRYWKVNSADKVNALGRPTAYKLAPGMNATPFLHPDAPVAKRAQFMFKHLWVTQYTDDQRFPAGWYPNQNKLDDGLAEWVKADRRLEGEDIVVWYTVNMHHLPRPEDWPVQPVIYAGFHWAPEGFFDENPALDVPPSGVCG